MNDAQRSSSFHAIMAVTRSNSPLREEAVASIETVATEIHRTVHQELDVLRSSLSAQLVALERALSRDRNDPAFDPVVERLCAIAAEQAEAAAAAARVQAEEAAAGQLAAARARAQTNLDAAQAQHEAARLELEQRLIKAEAVHAQSARALAEEARSRIDALEEERAQLLLSRDIAEAHLEGEVHNRHALEAELAAAREKALHAKADADACRLELQRTADRLRLFEQRQQRLDTAPPGTRSGEAGAALGQVRSALQRLSSATTGGALLDAVLELLAGNFSRVALFAFGPQGLTVWGSRGFDPPLQRRKAVIPATADSPLARALADCRVATVTAAEGGEPSGLSGSPIGYAIALPVMAKDRCAVILYAENRPECPDSDASVAASIAEILADHLGQRLTPRRAASAAAVPPPQAPHTPARQACRVRIQDGTNVAVDGATSRLVDLSILGAQVLSPRAIRPNGSVRLLLPDERGGLSCNARVVWVVVERDEPDAHALYRAGVQFTDADAQAVEAFFRQHGIGDPAIRH